MDVAALGSDTGGLIRIPAALCGLTGFKPTQSRVPTAGVIAPTARCCYAVDTVLSNNSENDLTRIIREAAEEWFCWQRDWSEDGCGRMRVLGLRRRRACSTAQWVRRGF
jgi:Asp-tRNA(Asn)/Glu-tRNA(Gln) amidotransferase A subunit family amidase